MFWGVPYLDTTPFVGFHYVINKHIYIYTTIWVPFLDKTAKPNDRLAESYSEKHRTEQSCHQCPGWINLAKSICTAFDWLYSSFQGHLFCPCFATSPFALVTSC